MCTLIALIGVVPDAPVVLAANRDELYDRPARAPVLLDIEPVRLSPSQAPFDRSASPDDGLVRSPRSSDPPRLRLGSGGVVGGLDLRSGGSWLAIARDGRFAGVTNQREAPQPPAPRSRGEWVRDLVACPDRAAMRAYVDGLDATQYASGNLMFGDASGVDLAYVRRAGTVERLALPAGITVLTNDRLGSPDFPKAAHAAARLAALDAAPWSTMAEALPAILGDHALPPVGQPPTLRPELPLPAELARALQAVCIHTPRYGTRSATIAAIGEDGVRALRWADGPPCTTPFVDAMTLFA